MDWTDVTNNQKAPLGSLVMVLELNIGFESVAGHQLSDGYLETSFHLALCFYGSVLISCPFFYQPLDFYPHFIFHDAGLVTWDE